MIGKLFTQLKIFFVIMLSIIEIASGIFPGIARQNKYVDELTKQKIVEFEPQLNSTFPKTDSSAHGPLRFYIMTDLHLWPNEFGYTDHRDQIILRDSVKIITATFDRIKQDPDIDIVLISGDLAEFWGNRVSHEQLRGLIDDYLVASGKELYIIPASHDYNDGQGMTREFVNQWYRDYIAPEKIVSICPGEYSYVTQIAPGYRLMSFVIDDGYTENTLAWAENQIATARESGEYIFAMQHYPFLSPSPIYPIMGGSSFDSAITDRLADAGLEFVFTGHSHMHQINYRVTSAGNTVYDISTASLIGYPQVWRKVTLRNDKMEIETLQLTEQELLDAGVPLGGMTNDEYFKAYFYIMLDQLFYGMAYDIELAINHEFGIPRDIAEQYGFIINFVGKLLYEKNIGDLAGLFLFSHFLGDETKNVGIKDAILEVIYHVFYGNEPYYPDTGLYKAFAFLIERVKPIVNLIDSSGNISSLLDMIRDELLYDTGPNDWNTELSRQN